MGCISIFETKILTDCMKKTLKNLHIINLLYIFVVSNKERRCENGMNRKKWLIARIAQLLDLIETDENVRIINQIRGLLNEL